MIEGHDMTRSRRRVRPAHWTVWVMMAWVGTQGILLLAGCFVCLGAVALGAESAQSAPEQSDTRTLDRIVAIIGREAVTHSEVGDHLGDQAIQSVIVRRLKLLAAQRVRITVSDEEVAAALAEFRQRAGLTTDEAFAKALEAERLTLSQYTAGLREQLLIQQLLAREIAHDLLVSEQEVRTVYEQNPQAFSEPREVQVAQMLFSFPPKASARDVAKSRERARKVQEQLRNGADFATLAARQSDGPEAARGGDLGDFTPGQLLPELEQAVSRLAPGEVSQAIQTPMGIHLMKLITIKTPRVRPFEEVRQTIEERLLREQGEHLLHDWLSEWRRRVYIEVRP